MSESGNDIPGNRHSGPFPRLMPEIWVITAVITSLWFLIGSGWMMVLAVIALITWAILWALLR
jgi:hypothetical protein